jgi:hypothetical protein
MTLQYLGTTPTPSIELPLDRIGPPGISSELHVLPQLENESRSNDERLNDRSIRQFRISACLSKLPPNENIISSRFSEKDGNSYLLMPSGVWFITVSTPQGDVKFGKNDLGEISFATYECGSDSITSAKKMFLRGILPFFDHMAYATNAPLFIAALWIDDPKNQHTTIYYVNPYHKFTVNSHARQVMIEMGPIYAMYREAKNSQSNFYKFLCYYKILEGLLGKIRASAVKCARKLGISPLFAKALVPDSQHFEAAQKSLVGMPLKKFFDEVLTPRYRAAVAHFITNKGEVLNMSDPAHLNAYTDILLACELCAREAIANHEALLQQITAGGALPPVSQEKDTG